MKKSLFKNKKGQADVFGQLGALGIGIVSLTILLAVAFLIMSNIGANAQVAANANATAAVNTLTVAMDGLPGWVPIVVIVVIGALLIALVRLFRS